MPGRIDINCDMGESFGAYGEVATIKHVSTTDLIKGSGPFMQYVTINFEDGSTITIKSQGTIGIAAGASDRSHYSVDKSDVL